MMDEQAEQDRLRDLGDYGRQAREELSLSRRALAKRVGIAHTTIGAIERGDRNLHESTLSSLFRGLRDSLRLLGIEDDFLQAAHELGYDRVTDAQPIKDGRNQTAENEITLTQLVRPSRDLRRNDVNMIRWHALPMFFGTDNPRQSRNRAQVRVMAQAAYLLAASYQEEASGPEVAEGVNYASCAAKLAGEIGDRFLTEVATWYGLVLRRKLVDLTSRERGAYARLRNEVKRLADATTYPAIQTLACVELTKLAISWGTETEVAEWLELGKATAERMMLQGQTRPSASWPPHMSEHAHVLLWDAVLRAQGAFGSSEQEQQEAVSRAFEQPEGLCTNLGSVSIPLSRGEARLRSATSVEQLREGASMVEGVRLFAVRESELKQELRARRILATLPDELRKELEQNGVSPLIVP